MSRSEYTEDKLLERFDAGEEVLDLFDTEHMEHPNLELECAKVKSPA